MLLDYRIPFLNVAAVVENVGPDTFAQKAVPNRTTEGEDIDAIAGVNVGPSIEPHIQAAVTK